jgi:hypothetical protein
MKKVLIFIVFVVVVLNTTLKAGKDVELVEVPVVPVSCPIGFYVGAGGTYHNLDKDCPCGDDSVIHDNTYGGTIRFGYDFNKYFGLEGRGIYSFGGDGFLDDMAHIGAFLKPQMPIGTNMNLYGLLGYGYNRLNCNCPNALGEHSHDIMAPSFGAGFEYHFKPLVGDKREGWGVWADAQNLMWDEEDDVATGLKSTVFSAGIMYNF